MTIVEELRAAGLAGRGGAAFSTAIKVQAAHDNRADLIVNACDGEIGATKDGWVVQHRLDELARGAALVTPHKRAKVMYAAHRDSGTARRLAAAGLPVLEVPHRYVSSEETSILSLRHGGLAKPMTKRAPFVYGGRDSHGRRIPPTVVLNAETTWRIHQIHTDGPEWFRGHGTPEEPGPRLVSLGGAVTAPGVVEAASGMRLLSIIDAAGGLDPAAPGVLVGGLGGVFLTPDEARTAIWSGPGMAEFGGSMGPGIVQVLDPSRCPVDVAAELIRYGAGESAGQCGPCMFGLPSIAADWDELVHDPNRETLTRLRMRLGEVKGRGACHHPDGVSRFAGSALRVFLPHLHEHVAGACHLTRRSHV